MTFFESYTVDQLNRALTASKWMLGIFGVIFALVGVCNQWITDRIAILQKADKTNSQERLKASEVELEQTKAKVQSLEAAAQPRTLTEKQVAIITNHLKSNPQTAGVIVTSKMLTLECSAFGEQILAAIVDAKWEAIHSPMAATNFRGIRVVTNGDAHASSAIIQTAFKAADVPFSLEPFEINHCPIQHAPAVYIFIGEKP